MLRECDYSQALLEQVNQAISDKTPLVIQGSNSKAFLGRPVTGQTLDVRCHRGIVNYDPTELVITARAGTPLVAIEAALESAGQMLPCEPPHYGEEATWGGMVACGLAGPRRPWSGSVRDFVLGTRIITGTGKHLRFGGEVMKNVTGYDLSRLVAGSYGCLGVLTEISMKVLPRPRATLSLRREISLQEAMNGAARDGAIHAVVIRGDTSYRRERIFATGPETYSLCFVLCQTDVSRTRVQQDVVNLLAVFLYVRLHAVQFA